MTALKHKIYKPALQIFRPANMTLAENDIHKMYFEIIGVIRT